MILRLALLLPFLVLPTIDARGEEKQRQRPAPAEGGLGSQPWQSWTDYAVPPPRPAWQYQQRIVYSFDKPASTVLTRDATLTKLCRENQFLQRINLRYRAFGPKERPLGVGFGSLSVNLYDPQQRRNADTVYFFKDQDTGRCAVFTAKLEDIRRYFIGP